MVQTTLGQLLAVREFVDGKIHGQTRVRQKRECPPGCCEWAANHTRNQAETSQDLDSHPFAVPEVTERAPKRRCSSKASNFPELIVIPSDGTCPFAAFVVAIWPVSKRSVRRDCLQKPKNATTSSG